MTGGPPLGQCTAAIPMTGTRMCPGRVTSSRRFASCSRIRSCCARLPPMRSFGAGASIVQEKSPRSNDAEPRASAGGKSPRGNAPRAPVPASAGHGHRARHHLPSAASHLQPRLGRKRVGQLRGESVGSRRSKVGKGALPAGLIRAARAIVGGAKAVTRPKPVEQPIRICLSIYRGTAGTLGFAIPPVSSPWAHDVIK